MGYKAAIIKLLEEVKNESVLKLVYYVLLGYVADKDRND